MFAIRAQRCLICRQGFPHSRGHRRGAYVHGTNQSKKLEAGSWRNGCTAWRTKHSAAGSMSGLSVRESEQARRRGIEEPESPGMKIEHFALQVPDPAAMADWYVKHLGLTVARMGGPPGHGRFLMDTGGGVLFEIYRNPRVAVPDYSAVNPLLMHLALLSENPAVDRDRLVAAGAQVADPISTNEQGDQLLMLRDPWGLPLQLIKRAEPMLRAS